jgi:signal transduction histidine kinase
MVRESVSRRSVLLDAAATVLLAGIVCVDLATRQPMPGQAAAEPLAYLLAAAIAAPFLVHRRFPLTAVLLSDLALVGYAAGQFSAYPGYATFALVFGVALHVGRRRAVVAYLLGLAGLLIALLLQDPGVATLSSWVATVLAVTVCWLAGDNLRTRRLRRERALADALKLARDREEEARRAVVEERLRIARDLHDLVAHSMSLIAVQAGVAHHLIDQRPELARETLGTIEVTARQALTEMRQLLGVLRADDTPTTASLTPTESLSDLPALLDEFRRTGLPVDAEIDGDLSGLPPALDLSAYRIVQEGLTNVLRHGGAPARLSVRRSGGDRLSMVISDPGRVAGRVPGTGQESGGHGLIGMRERAALFGGSVEAGTQPGGGFRVRVELPVPAVAHR